MFIKCMQFFRYFILIYSTFLTTHIYSQVKYAHENFKAPLDISLFLSGNFGELRSSHFHSGIDIKTQQQIGKNVYASQEGYISRIKIQSGSYGNALYITHPDGYTTVYGHLNDYIPLIARYIKNYQYQLKSFEVDVYPEKGEFPVSQGQLVAHSGNTGNSGGPHLHFEIRNVDQEPLNVLRFNFNIEDKIPPVILNMAVYPVTSNSFINSKNEKLIISPVKSNGVYELPDSLKISGSAGFGLETYDYLNGSSNRCTVYSIELSVDDTIYYYHEMDKFSFEEMKYVNSHMDYEEYILKNIKLHKLCPDPNNRLSIYKILKNRGIVDFSKDTVFHVKITVKDAYLNTSVLKFNVQGSTASYIHNQLPQDSLFLKTFFYNQQNTYQTPDFKISMPAYSLFKNINFTYSALHVDSIKYSDLHFVHSDLVPLCQSYSLSIKTNDLPETLQHKALIVSIDRENKVNAVGGDWKDGFITSPVKYFGKFFITIDTIAPEIRSITFKRNATYNVSDALSFRIKDNLSGIKSYNGFIDNHWALFEYDQKDDLLSYKIDPERIQQGMKHTIEIKVVDDRNNTATFTSVFYY